MVKQEVLTPHRLLRNCSVLMRCRKWTISDSITFRLKIEHGHGGVDETLLSVCMIVGKSVFWSTVEGIGQQPSQHLCQPVFAFRVLQTRRALGTPLCSVHSAPRQLADHEAQNCQYHQRRRNLHDEACYGTVCGVLMLDTFNSS